MIFRSVSDVSEDGASAVVHWGTLDGNAAAEGSNLGGKESSAKQNITTSVPAIRSSARLQCKRIQMHKVCLVSVTGRKAMGCYGVNAVFSTFKR